LRKVVFHPKAEEEIARSAKYYSLGAENLGEDFTAEIERTMERIQENPMAAVLVGTRARRRICKRFPFAVVYRLSDEEIRVIAITHLSRRSGYWRTRR